MRASTLLPSLFFVILCGCSKPASLEERLRSCDLIDEGDFNTFSLPFRVWSPCYDACYGSATCDELRAATCGDALELLFRCDQLCAYHCPDGSLLRVDQACDGIEDCEGGADERECTDPCPEYYNRCDGLTECRDGSDEAGCEPETFTCGGGRVFDHRARCDGWESCSDGSDEAGCATLTCP